MDRVESRRESLSSANVTEGSELAGEIHHPLGQLFLSVFGALGSLEVCGEGLTCFGNSVIGFCGPGVDPEQSYEHRIVVTSSVWSFSQISCLGVMKISGLEYY